MGYKLWCCGLLVQVKTVKPNWPVKSSAVRRRVGCLTHATRHLGIL